MNTYDTLANAASNPIPAMNAPLPAMSRWLSNWKPNPRAKLRLFCFPYAGGGSSSYRPWADRLPQTIDVFALQLPGRGNLIAEPPLTRLHCVVEAVMPMLLPYLDTPFAFFGHSMGSLIAFEIARLLRREHGLTPVQLFVSGHRAPQTPGSASPKYDLPESEFREELRRLNGMPQEVLEHPELMEVLLPMLRADFEVAHSYVYASDTPLDCPIMVLGGLQDPDVSGEDLESWREQTTGSFSRRMFPGDHFFIHTARNLLLSTLSQQLEL